MHQDIVAIREAMLAEVEASHRSGRAGLTELSRAKIALANARLNHAEVQGRRDEVRRELQTILSVHQDTLDALTLRRDGGRVTEHDLNEAQVAVLAAKIRLAQA